jgi:hypothetical protein
MRFWLHRVLERKHQILRLVAKIIAVCGKRQQYFRLITEPGIPAAPPPPRRRRQGLLPLVCAAMPKRYLSCWLNRPNMVSCQIFTQPRWTFISADRSAGTAKPLLHHCDPIALHVVGPRWFPTAVHRSAITTTHHPRHIAGSCRPRLRQMPERP